MRAELHARRGQENGCVGSIGCTRRRAQDQSLGLDSSYS